MSSNKTRFQRSLESSRVFLLSGFVEEEKRTLAKKISDLNAVYLETDCFKPSCTHVVCGKVSRSEKFLGACAMGKWILHPDFITVSSGAGEWQKEEDYEWCNYASDTATDMKSAARRWRFHVDVFQSRPFTGWKTSVVVHGSKKSAIYTRILTCGGADVYKLTLPVKNPGNVANVLTYVFVGERNASETLHLLDYGILCLRPEFIGDYLVQESDGVVFGKCDKIHFEPDPPPDPLDYLIKPATVIQSLNDMDTTMGDIISSQNQPGPDTSLLSLPGSNNSTPSASPLKLLRSSGALSNKETPSSSPSHLLSSTLKSREKPSCSLVRSPFREETSDKMPACMIKNRSVKRKILDDIECAVQELKKQKVDHKQRWRPSVFTGTATCFHSLESSQMPTVHCSREDSPMPFGNSLMAVIQACFEEDSCEPSFIQAGIDLISSSITEKRFPPPNIIKAMMTKVLLDDWPKEVQNRCYSTLIKVLQFHPPVTAISENLYLESVWDLSEHNHWSFISMTVTQLVNSDDSLSTQNGHFLLLKFIVAVLETNFQHRMERIQSEGNGQKILRGSIISQILWQSTALVILNSSCKNLVNLFGDCLAGKLSEQLKMEVSKLLLSMITMAISVCQMMERGDCGSLSQQPVLPSMTASSLLHETTRKIPGSISCDLLKTVLWNIRPPWISVRVCCLLLNNMDDYLILEGMPTDELNFTDIVHKYFFLLPKINSVTRDDIQSPHKRSRHGTKPQTTSKNVLQEKREDENNCDEKSTQRLLKNINKKNTKGETPLQVACIKNDILKVKQLLKLPGIDVNTCDNAGWTPLHEACNHGHVQIVKELLSFVPSKTVTQYFKEGEKQCKKVNLLAVTEELITPLHDAVMNDQIEVCKLLLQHGGSSLLECKTKWNYTPIDLAGTNQMKEILLSFKDDGLLKNCSQDSMLSECSHDFPTDYLYDQVLNQDSSERFADLLDCSKYIILVSRLVHSYLMAINFNSLQHLLIHKASGTNNQNINCNGRMNCVSNQSSSIDKSCLKSDCLGLNENCKSTVLCESQRKTEYSGIDIAHLRNDFRKILKLPNYVQKFVGHIKKICNEQDFAYLHLCLLTLQEIAESCTLKNG